MQGKSEADYMQTTVKLLQLRIWKQQKKVFFHWI